MNREARAGTVGYLHAHVEKLKAGGFVADALRWTGQADAAVAPLAGP